MKTLGPRYALCWYAGCRAANTGCGCAICDAACLKQAPPGIFRIVLGGVWEFAKSSGSGIDPKQ